MELRFIAIIGLGLVGCNATESASIASVESVPVTCSQAWYQQVEAQLPITDKQGHGPDIGSLEWRSAVEFKLGLRGNGNNPPVDSDQWCGYIQQQLQSQGITQ